MAQGQKPHEPTEESREIVKSHAIVGTPQEIVCKIIGVSDRTLRKYYREELDYATASANAVIGGELYNAAKNGNIQAQIFWMKTRAGWRETNNHNLVSEDGSMRPTTIIIEGGE